MATLYQVGRNTYECSCGSWDSIASLFYCRHCSTTRCSSCALLEIDCTYCPTCLESVPFTEARHKKHRCFTCNLCPQCSMMLTAKTCINSGNTFLSCGTCRWSTRDAGHPDQSKPAEWPLPDNPLSARMTSIFAHYKELEMSEKSRKENVTKRRSAFGFDGSKFSDRFGVQKMIQARRKAIEAPTTSIVPHEATEEVPILPEEAFTTPTIGYPMEVFNKQPIITHETPLLPIRVPLKGRKAIRCRKCEHHLLKLDFSATSINYKISAFARSVLPELRLSRKPELTVGQQNSLFITLLNHSETKMQVMIVPDTNYEVIEVLTSNVHVTLPPLDMSEVLLSGEEKEGSPSSASKSSDIVFRRRNVVGIRLDILLNGESKILPLILRFKNDDAKAKTTEGTTDWKTTKVRLTLM